jgi:uncharacterized ferritin-like protein (DUF455 family)
MVQQVVSEGNGLDMAKAIINSLASTGDEVTAELMSVQNIDESLHCEIGNKWVMLALGGNVEAYEGLLRSVEIKTGRTIPGQAPVDFDMRAISGFPHGSSTA